MGLKSLGAIIKFAGELVGGGGTVKIASVSGPGRVV